MPLDPAEPIVWDPALDVDTIPKVNPREVTRTEPDGKPTLWALNWEESTRAWFKKHVADLNKRLTKVYAETDYAYAAVTTLAEAFVDSEEAFASYKVTAEARFQTVEASAVTEQTARSTADTALASSITTVQTNVNNISASGAVYLSAKSAPSGATAAYGWYLTAGSAYAGMEALALSGGGSAIGFTANQFRFVDSGSAVAVWTYSGGKFVFTGAVEINGSLLLNGSVVTTGVAADAITQDAFSASGGINTGVVINVRSGGSVSIQAQFNGLAGFYVGLATSIGQVYVQRNGATIAAVNTAYEASGSGGSAGIAFLPTPVQCADTPGGGTHTYTVHSGNGAGIGGVSILVRERAR